LTNFEQQTEFVRKLGRIPANSGIWVDPKIYQAVAKFVEQSRSAVVLPNIPQLADVQAIGDSAYRHTLSGVSDARDAAEHLAQQVNTEYGFHSETPIVESTACELEGDIQLWFLPSENDGSVLEEIRRRFAVQCPKIAVDLVALDVEDDDEAYQRYTDAAENGNAPELLLGSNHLTAMLAAEGRIGELNDLLKAEFLQRYIPEVQRAMSHEGRLYALPVSISELIALYYNTDLVEDPPLVLNDLLNQASPERALLLPVDFYHGYWGLPAFGARLFDNDFRVVLDSSGMSDWLQWLKEADRLPGISVFPLRNEDDFEYVKRRFSEGHVAYFAGEAELLSEFQAALGDEKVRVVPLPAGPVGQSGPILGVNGVMVKANTTQAALEPALAFARYLTENESQNILMEQAKQIPANINIDTGAYPAIAGFLQQARTASVPPIVPQVESVFLWGDDAYYSSLDGQFAPEASVRHLATIANKMNGLTATETLTPQGCDADGTIRFQHSWRGE
ncbi:MAG: extracellular solute-binding protein, partial [bacterium]|nr:extracellular solute-binding protein [bacterium]